MKFYEFDKNLWIDCMRYFEAKLTLVKKYESRQNSFSFDFYNAKKSENVFKIVSKDNQNRC